jgi:hypothetical protein
MRTLLFSLATGLFFSTLAAQALTTNLVPVADTAMRSTASDSNFGGSTSLPVGVSNLGSPVNRTLFQFDLSALPANAIINDATLGLTVTVHPFGANFDLHRLLSSWSESEATWNNRLTSIPWAAGGALTGIDFSSMISATASLGSGVSAFNSPDLTADVQLWVDNPGSNFGWILMASGEPAGSGEQVASREDSVNTPTLTIDYTLPAPPTSPVIFGIHLVANQICFSFNAQSGLAYVVESRDSLTTGDWNVLTNIPAPPEDTAIDLTNTISSVERYFRVRAP